MQKFLPKVEHMTQVTSIDLIDTNTACFLYTKLPYMEYLEKLSPDRCKIFSNTIINRVHMARNAFVNAKLTTGGAGRDRTGDIYRGTEGFGRRHAARRRLDARIRSEFHTTATANKKKSHISYLSVKSLVPS